MKFLYFVTIGLGLMAQASVGFAQEAIVRQIACGRSSWGASQSDNHHCFSMSDSGVLYYSNRQLPQQLELVCPAFSAHRERPMRCWMKDHTGNSYVFERDPRMMESSEETLAITYIGGAPRGDRGDGGIEFRLFSMKKPLRFSASLSEYPALAEECLSLGISKLAAAANQKQTSFSSDAVFVSDVDDRWYNPSKYISFAVKANNGEVLHTLVQKNYLAKQRCI